LNIFSFLFNLPIVKITTEFKIGLVYDSLIVRSEPKTNANEYVLNPNNVTHTVTSFRPIEADGQEHDWYL